MTTCPSQLIYCIFEDHSSQWYIQFNMTLVKLAAGEAKSLIKKENLRVQKTTYNTGTKVTQYYSK